MRMTVFKKIRSRKGASITFALLAFLVCAVIGSVVLSAAIASSGRVSGLAEMDQRYYAVTSAAQLFSDALDGQSYTIERIEMITDVDVWEYKPASMAEDGAGSDALIISEHKLDDCSQSKDYYLIITLPDGSTLNFPSKSEDESETSDGESDPDPAAEPLATISDFRKASLLNDAALTYLAGSASDETEAYGSETNVPGKFAEDSSNPWYTERELTMSFAADSGLTADDLAALGVNITVRLRKDGALIFTFENNNSSTEQYKLQLTVTASVSGNSTNPQTTQNVDVKVTGETAPYVETTTTITTNTKTTTIVWKVADVKRVDA